MQLKRNVVNDSNVNGIREPILYNFDLTSLHSHKIYKKPRVELFKKDE